MSILIVIWLLIQVILNILLAISLRYVSLAYNIKINIHNLPIIIMWSLGMLGIMWLSVINPTIFLCAGSVMGYLIWMVQSDVPQPYSIFRRIFGCLVGTIVWAQLLTAMLFFAFHEQVIEKFESEKSKLR